MDIQDWVECGYTVAEAKELIIKYAHEIEYENKAHAAFAEQNLYE
jgi:hypothetical protein